MAQAPFTPKSRLFDLIRSLVVARETGLLSILTDTKRSVLLRFSEGRLTHSYCRSKDVAEAIGVLNECELVRFTYAPASAENRPELMPTETFLQLIDPGGDGESGPAQQVTAARKPLTDERSVDMVVREALLAIALDYVGVVADMVVDEALESTGDVFQAIEYIADLIPDPKQAAAFREAAKQRIPDLSL